MHRICTITAVFIAAAAIFISALPADTSVETYAGTELTATASYPFIGARADVQKRSTLPSSGYFSFYGSTQLEYFLGNVSDYEDREVLSLTVGKPLGPGVLKGQLGLQSTLHGLTTGNVSARPDWALSYRLGKNQPTRLTFTYDGLYLFQEGVKEGFNEDRLLSRGGLKLSYDPSLYYGGSLALKAGLEQWYEYPIYDKNGFETQEERRDYRFSGQLRAEGLAGYFADWYSLLEVETRLSNANRYLTSVTPNTLESNSEDRLEARLNAGLNADPAPQFNLRTNAYLGTLRYFNRAALDSNEQPIGETLAVMETGGSVTGTLSSEDGSSFTATLRGGRDFSKDPDFDQWNARMELGYSYRF